MLAKQAIHAQSSFSHLPSLLLEFITSCESSRENKSR